MKEQRILIVEDEADIRELIHFHLYRQKFEVHEAENGLVALEMIQTHKPDLILLDIMIPGIDGLTLCQKLKETPVTSGIKIIFLSARGSEEDIVKGLELGADDYITKPFSPKVLMARIKTVLKRHQNTESEIISYHGITLDNYKRLVKIEEEEVSMTASEYEILKYLMSSRGHVFTRSQIVNAIRGHNHAVTDRSIDTQLVSLRKKMGSKGSLIETVWGIGYRFKENVQ